MGAFYRNVGDALLDLLRTLEAGCGKIPHGELVEGTLAHIRRLQTGPASGEMAWRRRATRNLYVKRKAAGLCVVCGRAPAIQGITVCPSCHERAKRYARERRAARAAGADRSRRVSAGPAPPSARGQQDDACGQQADHAGCGEHP